MTPLRVLRVFAITPARQKVVLVQCRCGNRFNAYLHNVTSGNTRSCGCMTGSTRAVMEISAGHGKRSYWKWLDKGDK